MELERDDIKKSLRNSRLTKLDRESVLNLQKEIKEKLDVIGEIYGVKLEVGRIKFDSIGFKASISAQIESFEDKFLGQQISGEQAAFERAVFWLVGIDKSNFNEEVVFPGGKFRGQKGNIVAINKRAKKYPVIIRLKNGNGNVKVTINSAVEMIRTNK